MKSRYWSANIILELQQWVKRLADRSLEDIEEQGIEVGLVIVCMNYVRPMQREVRDHLKSRLLAYGVPTYFIFLDKMPLNTNGKIDSPNLPFSDAAPLSEEASGEDLKRWEAFSDSQGSS